jgi:hypothetical protein
MIGNGGISGLSKGAGYDVINKFGENADIDTGTVPEAIWSHGGAFPFLSAGIQADIKSSDANDTLAGTGAQKVKITYHLSDYTKVVETKDMNGLTQVQLNDDFLFCSRMEIVQSGSGKTNAGEINIVDRATGLIVYQSMEIGEGQTLSAVQICPKDKKGLVKCHSVTYARTAAAPNDAQLRLRLRAVDGSVLTKHNITISKDKPFDQKEYNIGGIQMAAGEIIFWECVSVSADNTPIEGRFDIEFEDV